MLNANLPRELALGTLAQGVRLIAAETTGADLIAELKLRHQEETSEPEQKG